MCGEKTNGSIGGPFICASCDMGRDGKSFKEGYASRDSEVNALKTEVERLKNCGPSCECPACNTTWNPVYNEEWIGVDKFNALKAELRKSEDISIKCQENVYEQEGEIESLKAENAKFRKSLEDILNPNEGTNIHARMIAEHALGGVK